MTGGTARSALPVVLSLIAFVAIAAFVAACTDLAPPGQTPTSDSGISGTVILGPTCATGDAPGAHEPVPCLTPYSAQLAVLDGENVVVIRATSDAEGRFRVTLPPGDYVVAPQGGDPYPIAQPIPVTVPAGEYVEIEINYDTGIR
jgi:hypothetical protein